MKRNTHCIFRRGDGYAETSAHTAADGALIAAYTDNENVFSYLARKNAEIPLGDPRFEILPWAEAMPILEEDRRAKYVTDWQEIDEETWWERLEILPPEKRQTVHGVEIFRICERLTGNITQHLARLGNRYFSRNCETTIPYTELAAQVAKLAA